MKKRAPVFSYIVAWLNPIIPTTVTGLAGGCFVLYTDPEGNTARTWNDLHFRGMLVGAFVCLSVSVWYYVHIRNGRLKPRWWTNLLLILGGYLSYPLFSLIVPEDTTMASRPVLHEFWLISPVIFLIAMFLSGKSRPKPAVGHGQRFRSRWWIPAFIPAYYILFFGSMTMSTVLAEAGLFSLGWLLYVFNMILRIPLFSPLTYDWIFRHFPGPMAHIVIVLNALIWSVAAWLLMASLRRWKQAESAKGITPPISDT